MDSSSLILQDVEPSEMLNVNHSRSEVVSADDMCSSIQLDSNGVAQSPSAPGIFDGKNVTNSNAIDDTRVSKTEGRSHYDESDKAPATDIIVEAQNEYSSAFIIRCTMESDEKLQKDHDIPPSSHRTPSTMLTVPADDYSNFIKEFIDLHNKCREKHRAPPLEFSKELSEFSQNWADSLAARSVMENSNSSLGENIFYKSGFEMDPNEPIDFWYKESIDYPYGSSDFQRETGHFTQLVWKESSKLGVGIANNPSTGTYVAAHYYPPGNIHGEFTLNVLPPSD